MLKKFRFDYDEENDSLFIYDPKSKSKGSVEVDNLIMDLDTNKDVVALEILNATDFFKDVSDVKVTKQTLAKLHECKLEIIPRGSFFLFKIHLKPQEEKAISTSMFVPNVKENSPAVASS